jgi:hypothetical protein
MPVVVVQIQLMFLRTILISNQTLFYLLSPRRIIT